MVNLQAVIFDMDGLMFNTEWETYLQQQKAADELGLTFNIDTYRGSIGLSGKLLEDYFAQVFPSKDDYTAFITRSDDYVADMKKDAQAIAEKAGLRQLLDFLRDNNIDCYIASSSDRATISHHLQTKGLADYFKAYIGGDQVAFSKPSPDLYLAILDQMGTVSKDKVLVLEDSKNGIIAAYKAGLPVINIPDMIEPDEEMRTMALEVLGSLNEVKEYLSVNYQLNV